jgi:hypothetical protein
MLAHCDDRILAREEALLGRLGSKNDRMSIEAQPRRQHRTASDPVPQCHRSNRYSDA